MESYEKRLQRLSSNPPDEIILTILNVTRNSMVPQLAMASKYELHDLVILGIHAAIKTITEHVFLKPQKSGFKFYLENFVDGTEPSCQFSRISLEIYDLRNVIAHQCLSKLGHVMGYDNQQEQGYRVESDILWVNTSIYFEQFLAGFEGKGATKHWLFDYEKFLDQETMDTVKTKYLTYFQKV